MLKFVLGACFWILLIGLTRIYLGAHYLTDVIGALAAGSSGWSSAGLHSKPCIGDATELDVPI